MDISSIQREFASFAAKNGQLILEWANPGAPASPLAGWPLTDFESALGIAMCYLAFVLFGSVSDICNAE
jgi:hypothetical protein